MRSWVEDFMRALQFLTRLPVFWQVAWSQAALGRSARLFPLIGALIGLLLAGLSGLFRQFPAAATLEHVTAAALVASGIVITGGLHCDGFMDTLDGVFSGRSREDMLKIMKDSRVGSFGAVGFALLVLVRYSILLDIKASLIMAALFSAPVVARMAAVVAIYRFPYARAEGLGKMFNDSASGRNLGIALGLTALLLAAAGPSAFGAGMVSLLVSFAIAGWFNKILDGLTGDVYGAVIEITEVLQLILLVLWQQTFFD